MPDIYKLEETRDASYSTRTRANVRDSDATVVFTDNPPGRGSALTIRCALDLGKPYLVVTMEQAIADSACYLLAFLRRNNVKVLNVAGSRMENFHHRAILVLRRAWADEAKRVEV